MRYQFTVLGLAAITIALSLAPFADAGFRHRNRGHHYASTPARCPV